MTPNLALMASVRSMRVLDWLDLFARVVLGVVFGWAGLSKVGDLAGSVRAVNAYDLMPYGVSTVVGSVLPFVEVALGVLLLAGLATRLAAGVTAVLLVAFTAGIASAWARGLSIDCGCFGSGGALATGESPQYGPELLRDLGLLALATLLVVRPDQRWSIDRWLAGDDIDVNDDVDGTANPDDPGDTVAIDGGRRSDHAGDPVSNQAEIPTVAEEAR